jgi:hypothetical protein
LLCPALRAWRRHLHSNVRKRAISFLLSAIPEACDFRTDDNSEFNLNDVCEKALQGHALCGRDVCGPFRTAEDVETYVQGHLKAGHGDSSSPAANAAADSQMQQPAVPNKRRRWRRSGPALRLAGLPRRLSAFLYLHLSCLCGLIKIGITRGGVRGAGQSSSTFYPDIRAMRFRISAENLDTTDEKKLKERTRLYECLLLRFLSSFKVDSRREVPSRPSTYRFLWADRGWCRRWCMPTTSRL